MAEQRTDAEVAMTTSDVELLERFRAAAERGAKLRSVPCRWEGKVVYRRQCCDYVECLHPSSEGEGALVVKKTGCRSCLSREPLEKTEDGQQ